MSEKEIEALVDQIFESKFKKVDHNYRTNTCANESGEKPEDIYDIFNQLKDKEISIIDSVILPRRHYEYLLRDVKEEKNITLALGFGMKMIVSDLLPEEDVVIKYQDGSLQVWDLKTGKMSAKVKPRSYQSNFT